MATNTFCLRRELCIHFRTVVESVQKLHFWIFDSCSLTICSFSTNATTAACNSKRGIEKFGVGATLHFQTTNAKSAEYSLGCERRYATAHIVSLDASAKTWSSHLPLAVLKNFLSMLVSATSRSWSFHFRNSSSSLGFADLSQCCHFLSRFCSEVGSCGRWMVQKAQENQTLMKLEKRISSGWLGFQIRC